MVARHGPRRRRRREHRDGGRAVLGIAVIAWRGALAPADDRRRRAPPPQRARSSCGCGGRAGWCISSAPMSSGATCSARRAGTVTCGSSASPGSSESGAREQTPARLAEQIEQAGATTLVLSAEAIRDETICAAASLCNVQGRRVRALSALLRGAVQAHPAERADPELVSVRHRRDPSPAPLRRVQAGVRVAARRHPADAARCRCCC